ncbi:MAG: hypothetical protein ACPGOY_04380 [Rhodospirillaceae bacterium]
MTGPITLGAESSAALFSLAQAKARAAQNNPIQSNASEEAAVVTRLEKARSEAAEQAAGLVESLGQQKKAAAREEVQFIKDQITALNKASLLDPEGTAKLTGALRRRLADATESYAEGSRLERQAEKDRAAAEAGETEQPQGAQKTLSVTIGEIGGETSDDPGGDPAGNPNQDPVGDAGTRTVLQSQTYQLSEDGTTGDNAQVTVELALEQPAPLSVGEKAARVATYQQALSHRAADDNFTQEVRAVGAVLDAIFERAVRAAEDEDRLKGEVERYQESVEDTKAALSAISGSVKPIEPLNVDGP